MKPPVARFAASERLYAAALHLFPRDMRLRFGDEMRLAFREQCLDSVSHGNRGAARLLCRTLCDLLAGATREHLSNFLQPRLHGRLSMRIAKSISLVAIGTVLLTFSGIAVLVSAEFARINGTSVPFSLYESRDLLLLALACAGVVFFGWGCVETRSIASDGRSTSAVAT